MPSKEQQHPFYRPLWRRIAIVVVIVLWIGFEFWQGGASIWVMIGAGMLVYAVYTFFLTWPRDAPEGDGGPEA
jgi:hypothetical protein